jgi:hypothetical protein
LSISGQHADDATPAMTDLAVMPAEVLSKSTVVDPTGQWLAFAAQATTPSNSNSAATLCVIELRPGGSFRDVADLGPAQRMAAVAPLAWPPADKNGDAARLASPRLSPKPAPIRGLACSTCSQPCVHARLPRASSLSTWTPQASVSLSRGELPRPPVWPQPVWHNESTIYGFSRADDVSLSLQAVDVSSGTIHDTGGRIPAGMVQGSGLGARWDLEHGRALLLTRPSTASGQSAGGLQAWLVSFLSSGDVQP